MNDRACTLERSTNFASSKGRDERLPRRMLPPDAFDRRAKPLMPLVDRDYGRTSD